MKWSDGLYFTQFMKNRAYHLGINRSLHEAIFDLKTKVEINTYLPLDFLTKIHIYELEIILNENDNKVDSYI